MNGIELKLSPQQERIVDWCISESGNLIIQAYAGCGKSQTLLMVLPYLSGKVLMAAFNKSAQQHLESQVAKMGLSNVEVKTIHAAGLAAFKYGGGSRTARVESNKIRLLIQEISEDDPFYTQFEQFLFKLVGYAKRAGIGVLVDDDTDTAWEDLIDYYSLEDELPFGTIDKAEEVSDRLLANLIDHARSIYNLSLERCKEELDFDDMLLAGLHYRCRFPQYDWVLIDEMQDISAIHREMLIRMLKPDGRMIGVGDKNQCIYIFAGATHNAMEILQERMHMTVLPLSVSYRCPKKVVDLAHTWVPGIEHHEDAPDGVVRSVYLEPEPCKPCNGTGYIGKGDAEKECEVCHGSGKSQPGFWDEAHTLGPEDAILCRNNRPVIELAYQLLRKGIPCQIEGRDFAGSLIKLCQRWKTRELDDLEKKLENYRTTEAAKWRKKLNEERAVGVEDKIDTLLTLLDALRSTGKSKVSDLIDKINAMFGDTVAGTKPKVLTLSSIHRAKGLQWKRVYVLGRNRYQPSRFAKQAHEIQSEKNLLYVGTTRSQFEYVDIIVPEDDKRKRRTY